VSFFPFYPSLFLLTQFRCIFGDPNGAPVNATYPQDGPTDLDLFYAQDGDDDDDNDDDDDDDNDDNDDNDGDDNNDDDKASDEDHGDNSDDRDDQGNDSLLPTP
jgi:hypothetical protein